MKKHIAEDLPARKFPQASLSKGGNDRDRQGEDRGGDGGEKTPEKRVRQAVYDIKYRARRENIPLRSAYTQYMQNSSMSEQEKAMVREKLFGKGGIVKEAYTNDISGLATKSVARAMYNVFVEPKSEHIDHDHLRDELEETANVGGDKKYKVRVTDKNGTSYVRYATREKINSLRANPNIDSVEMTEYGEPYEGEKKKGEQTAAATSGKDWDGDGKKESGAKEYRGVVHNAIQRRRGGVADGKDTSSVKEEFIGEVKKNKTSKPKTYDVMRGTNNSRIKVSPQDGVQENAYSEFLNILNEKTLTKAEKIKKEEIVKKLKPQYGKTSKTYAIATSVAKRVAEGAECGSNDEKEMKIKTGEKGLDDPRSIPTKVSLFKNKLRSMGLKMDYEPEGDLVDEARASEKRGMGSPETPLEYPGRKVKKSRGEKGGRHYQSGGEGGSRTERGMRNVPRSKSKKEPNEPESQSERLRRLSSNDQSGKYIKMQQKKRDIGSRHD